MTMRRARPAGWLRTCHSKAPLSWRDVHPPPRGHGGGRHARGADAGFAEGPRVRAGRGGQPGGVDAAYRDKLAAAPDEAAVGSVMRFGVSTVRPSEDAAALAHW